MTAQNSITQMQFGDPLPMHDAQLLTEGGAMALIQLNEQIYTLRITRAGKLILTK
ncbi:hemin uptake protein HemP [Actibacterium ureilyticum]|uniref:hemin uptake protein HemP n=1 Tax=Actibacterium ureilyticum TaxID=1590614 RepID=UPI0009E04970|nr:hemin uptake protein HemP [Actibacterium ureilyticum]